MTDVPNGETGGQAAAPSSEQEINPPDFRSVKHKVKIEDQEAEVDYDELVKGYQNQKVSTKRYQEAGHMLKQAKAVEALIEQARHGDLSWLEGIVPEEQLTKWAESNLLKHIEYAQLSEHQKEALAEKKRAEKLEKELESFKRRQEQETLSAMEQKAVQEIDVEIAEAIKGLGHNVKVTPRLIRRIAEQIEASILMSDDENAPMMPAKIASERAYKGLELDFQEYLELISSDKLLEILPPKHREAIRKRDVDDVTKQLPYGAKGSKKTEEPDFTEETNPQQKKFKRLSTDDYFARMDKKLGLK